MKPTTLRQWLAALLASISIAPAVAADVRALDHVPMLALDAAAVQHAVEAVPDSDPHGARPIAAMVPVSAGLEDGAWEIDGDTAVWRLRLYSTGAQLMLAHLDRLRLPEGASLRFMSADASVVQGPWTRRERRKHAAMWTPMVPGDTAVLELRTPRAARDDVRLHVAAIGHGIVAPFAKSQIEPKSGSCNIDVVCPQGDTWENQIRSVVRLQVPRGLFVYLCTGTLLNNTAQDGTPYVVTAHHCGARSSNEDGLVAYFNYQTTSCGGTPNGSLAQALTGATVRADHAASDHTLIELDATPPGSYAAYYAGFDATSGATPSSGAAIHHPNGDEKRISLYDAAAVRTTTAVNGVTVSAFRVSWSQGVTEQGSSGSGLLNQDRLLTGVLSTGSTSCSNPEGSDNFGRLETAWTGGNLKAWLDPGNTGTTRVTGSSSPGGGGGGGGSSGGSGGGGGGAWGAVTLAFLIGAGILRRFRPR